MPDLAAYARTARRLHPYEAQPTTSDSHIGGPLTWPADEPWPVCAQHRSALVGGAQFHRHDFPALPFPDDADVLQILLCATNHDDPDYYGPDVRVIWRSAAAVTSQAPPVPAPVEPDEDLLPGPRLFRPCDVTDSPHHEEVPEELKPDTDDEVEAWPSPTQSSKVGGWAYWYVSSPREHSCRDCGASLDLLVALSTNEFADDGCTCESADDPAGWQFAEEGALNVFVCSTDVRHEARWMID